MKNLKRLIVAFILVAIIAPLAAPVAYGESGGPSKPLSVCTDAEQKQKNIDKVDVLLLMDNSRSLKSAKGRDNSTDFYGERFAAVGDLLESLASLTESSESQEGVSIDFGMVSFGKSARTEIAFRKLEKKKIKEIKTQVQVALPEKDLENETDYIGALNHSLKMLNGRPDNNCKFLVWFTDGQFEQPEISSRLTETERRAEVAKQVAELKNAVCEKPDGIAERFHTARINTFVLVLQPKNTDGRLDASYGAMQAITGAFGADQVPAVVDAGKQPDLCGDISTRDHIGDILVAEDASSIARKIPTIGNKIDGWEEVGACPISSDSADMPEMPAARHLRGISFTAYEMNTNLVSLERSKIIDNDLRKRGFEEFLIKEKSSSKFERKFSFNDAAIKNLQQGWTFAIDKGEVGWCVQILHQNFVVKFTETSVVEVNPGGLLTTRDLANITYATAGDKPKTLSLIEARKETGKVDGFLDIDPNEKLYEKPIPVEVQQLTVPSLSCSEVVFVADGEDMPTNPNRKKTEDCIIDTSMTNLGSVEVQVVQGDSLSKPECSANLRIVETEPTVEWNDSLTKDLTSSLVHPKSKKRIHVVLQFDKREAECSSEGESSLKLTYQSGEEEKVDTIPISINIDLVIEAIWWLRALIVFAILLLVALLNLWLLRIVAGKSSRMSRFGVDAYEVPITLRKNSGGRVEAVLRDGSSPMSHRFDLEMKIPVHVETNGLAASFNKGSFSKLKVIVPPLHRPFAEPSLTLASLGAVSYSGPAIYWESVNGGRGLSPIARSGVILHSPEKSGESVNVVATFLLPSSGLDRQIFVREVLASRIVSTLQSTLLDERWFGSGGESQVRPSGSPPRESRPPGEQNMAPPGGAGRPPQPPPPRPPSRP
jgi:hypothetical protein